MMSRREAVGKLGSGIQVYMEPAPRLRNPILVCGLPDSGNVAKLVIQELVKQLKPKKLAEIYSNSLPPKVMIREDGTVEVMKHSMFYWNAGTESDIVLYTGDAQPKNPDAAYALADKALEIAQSFGVNTVLTVGAYITGEFSGEPKVFATGTDKDSLEGLRELGVTTITEGNITWMNGILVGLSKLRKMKAMFLSGETSGYIEDAGAARAVLAILAKKLDITLDLTALDLKARESTRIAKSIEAMKGHSEKDETGYIG
jgi:uncharacterized protein (TIGR00162 family)